MIYETPFSIVEAMADAVNGSNGDDIVLPDHEFANPGT